MDIKEIVNLLYTAIDLAADGGPKAFTDEEYSEMHELLKKIKSGQFGWHPASEPPKEDGEYVVKKECGPARADLFYSKFENGKWSTPQVKWWTYPPEDE